MKVILKNGRILDPSQELDITGSIVIEDDQVVDLGPKVSESDADEIYDCTGFWITPGLIDPHVHLREPGQEHKETIITGTQAAAAGGYTTICCMPNTNPPLDNPTLVDYILDRSASPEAGGVFVAPVGAMTVGLKNEQLTDFTPLKRAGVVAISDEGAPIQDSLMMLRIMEASVMLDLPIMAHCEDKALSREGCMNEGAMSAMLGLKGVNRCAEEIMVIRNCLLSLHTGCQLHVMRVSLWGSVEMIRQAKYLGAPVTCTITPHHLVLKDENIGEFNTHFKTNPPLRSQADIDLLIDALKDGTIDCISSDHSPHATYEVESPFEEAPFGVAGLESTLGVILTHITHKGILSPLETIRKMSTAPAQIFRLEGGTLRPKEAPIAQVTVIDPHLHWVFDVKKTFSKGKNSPYQNAKLKGKAVLTFCGGEIYRDAYFDESRYRCLF